MARKWLTGEKRKQSLAIQKWKPWVKSTGPKTQAGKERCRMNAYKSGAYSENVQHLRKVLRNQVKWLKKI